MEISKIIDTNYINLNYNICSDISVDLLKEAVDLTNIIISNLQNSDCRISIYNFSEFIDVYFDTIKNENIKVLI
jgi:hypothetical protein